MMKLTILTLNNCGIEMINITWTIPDSEYLDDRVYHLRKWCWSSSANDESSVKDDIYCLKAYWRSNPCLGYDMPRYPQPGCQCKSSVRINVLSLWQTVYTCPRSTFKASSVEDTRELMEMWKSKVCDEKRSTAKWV